MIFSEKFPSGSLNLYQLINQFSSYTGAPVQTITVETQVLKMFFFSALAAS